MRGGPRRERYVPSHAGRRPARRPVQVPTGKPHHALLQSRPSRDLHVPTLGPLSTGSSPFLSCGGVDGDVFPSHAYKYLLPVWSVAPFVTGEAARPGPANTSGPSALPWGRVNSRAPRRGSRHCSGGPRPGSRFLRVLLETRLPGEPAFEASPRRRQTRQERFLPPRRLSVHDARTGVLLRDPPKPVTQQGLCRQEARKASSREINPLPASAKHPGARPGLCPPGPGEPRPHPEKPRSDWEREDDAAVKALASDSDLPPRHRGLIPSPLRASAPSPVNWGHNGFRPTASFSE